MGLLFDRVNLLYNFPKEIVRDVAKDFYIKMLSIGAWRDGSLVLSPDCSFRGPGLDSQHPHGSSVDQGW